MLFLLDSLHCLKWVIFLLKLNFCSRTGVLWSVEMCAFLFHYIFLVAFCLQLTWQTILLHSEPMPYFTWGTHIIKAGVELHLNEPGRPAAKLIEEFGFPLFPLLLCDLSYPHRNGTYCLKCYSLILLLYKSVPTFPFT